MGLSVHPSRPSARTWCFFSSLKPLLPLTEGNPHVMLNVLGSTPLAGFQVILIGRFWVIPEALVVEKTRHSSRKHPTWRAVARDWVQRSGFLRGKGCDCVLCRRPAHESFPRPNVRCQEH